ncbi:hypothetical protein AAHA92_14126 [Salvia divinorum]|uniref:Uncharacterized protein n=1 Tax=Salvia divinorum TaxID=28513 RepID=A0ABD1HAJ3_SALDI
MNTFTPSTVTSNSGLLQPKIEANLLAEDDLHLGSFQQLETQLLDCMGISDQQPLHSHKIQVSGEDYMHEPGGSIDIPLPGNKNSACLDAPSEEQGLDKRLTHADRLHKCLKRKIAVLFRKKDGHPVGKYASVFMKELCIAVKKHAPLQVQDWKKVTDEQKRPIFQQLENAFLVDFNLGPNSVKKETDKLMSKKYRVYRLKMHKHYKTLTHLPWEDRLKHVPEELCKSEADWLYMCKLFESETFKKLSLINSRIAATPKPTKYRRDGLRPSDAASLIAANAELRSELHNARTAIQLMEDKVRTLEANQKRLEEIIKANTQIVETNQLMMQRVFEKLASDIAQSRTSSAPPPPPPSFGESREDLQKKGHGT